jgi:hypothetical protein
VSRSQAESSDDRGLLRRFIRSPWATVAGGLGLAGQGLGVVDPLGLAGGVLSLFIGTADLWFPLLNMFRRLGGIVAWVPASLSEQLFVAGVVVYGGYLVLTLVDSWTDRIKQLLKRNKS